MTFANFCIGEAENVSIGKGLRLGEDAVNQWCAVSGMSHTRNMHHCQLSRTFSHSFIRAEENDLGIGHTGFPALDRVALNHAEMACEGLGNRERWGSAGVMLSPFQ